MAKDVVNRAQKGLLEYLKLKELKATYRLKEDIVSTYIRRKDSYPGYRKNIRKLIRKREMGKSREQILQRRRYSSGN